MPNFHLTDPELSLVAAGERSCTGTITNPNTGWSKSFSVTQGVSSNISIPLNQAYNFTSSDQKLNTVLHVTTSDSISLYASNFYDASFDIANVLPTSALGSEYVLQTYHNPQYTSDDNLRSVVSVIAVEDNTTINITLKCDSRNDKHYANYPYSVTLNAGQCYQVESISGGDFSGSTITTNDNKKIAVFAGNVGALVPDGQVAVDHIFEQMMPTSCWGKNFVVTNSKMRTKDRVRVTALNNNCQIRKDGNLLTTLNAKQTYEFEITDSQPAIYLETSEPAAVFLYLTGASYGGAMGDPAMVIISPIEQRIDNVTFSSFQTEISEYHFVNIITDSDNVNHMKLDGSDISSKFTSVPSKPEYSYARIEVEHGSHTISNVSRSEYSGFVAHIYGLGSYESYAYSVGSMAINLSSQLILNGLSTLDYPEGFDFCINNNDSINFDLKLNYTPTDVVWDFGDGSTGSGAPINHYYEEIGDYDVTCEVYKLENGINKLVSTLSTSLHINNVYDTLIIDTICEGNDYMDYNFNIINPSAGVHNKIQNLSTIYGCDSIVRLELTVHPSFDTLFIDTICQWDSYIQNGFVFDSMPAGFYQDTLFLNTINGCDSIVKLNLIVGQLYDTTIVDYICEGETYNLNNFYFDANKTGNYLDTLFLTSIYGCDSIVKLNLTINPIYDTIISASICEGEDYTENGFSFINKPAGSYNDILSLNTIHGCDSIVRLNLTVNPNYDITISESICEGESYKDNGFIFENMTAGSYNDIQLLKSIHGCDSIVRIELTVHQNYDTTISASICEGEDYTENGFSFLNKPAGSYQDYLLLNSIHGCDSTVRIHLTVNETYSYDIQDSICEGEDYHMYGLDLINPNAGTYEHVSNLYTINGCDSIISVSLKVINKYENVVIEGLEEISVATNLSTGCYKYTIGDVGKHELYTWEIDNEEWEITPDNNECIVCATTPGKGTLYVRAENYCGSVYDYIVLNADFIENQKNSKVTIYPNPITDFVNIQQSDISRINVYDSFGQIVIENNYNFDDQVTLDLSNLRSSIYIIEIITLEQTFVERVYIKK